MTYNAEQITFMLAEAIDQDQEYKSWHVSTKHLMTLVEMVVAQERERINANIKELERDAARYREVREWDFCGYDHGLISPESVDREVDRARGQA